MEQENLKNKEKIDDTQTSIDFQQEYAEASVFFTDSAKLKAHAENLQKKLEDLIKKPNIEKEEKEKYEIVLYKLKNKLMYFQEFKEPEILKEFYEFLNNFDLLAHKAKQQEEESQFKAFKILKPAIRPKNNQSSDKSESSSTQILKKDETNTSADKTNEPQLSHKALFDKLENQITSFKRNFNALPKKELSKLHVKLDNLYEALAGVPDDIAENSEDDRELETIHLAFVEKTTHLFKEINENFNSSDVILAKVLAYKEEIDKLPNNDSFLKNIFFAIAEFLGLLESPMLATVDKNTTDEDTNDDADPDQISKAWQYSRFFKSSVQKDQENLHSQAKQVIEALEQASSKPANAA